MPIYEYEREDGSVFEVTQRITEEALETCPETGQAVRRIISLNAFHLKGGGWYKSEYGTMSGGDKSGASKSGETEATKSSSSSNEAARSDSSDTPSEKTTDTSTTKKACNSSCAC